MLRSLATSPPCRRGIEAGEEEFCADRELCKGGVANTVDNEAKCSFPFSTEPTTIEERLTGDSPTVDSVSSGKTGSGTSALYPSKLELPSSWARLWVGIASFRVMSETVFGCVEALEEDTEEAEALPFLPTYAIRPPPKVGPLPEQEPWKEPDSLQGQREKTAHMSQKSGQKLGRKNMKEVSTDKRL